MIGKIIWRERGSGRDERGVRESLSKEKEKERVAREIDTKIGI
jgi:hypothetical protein